jgi:sugar phosphate isomerase/epimerase
MDFGISTQFHRKQRVTVDLLESLRKAGYNRIELFCNRPHIDFHDRSLLRAIGRWFEENALPAPSIHLPFLEDTGNERRWITPLDPERRQREAAIDEMKRCLELAERVHPEYVVMHLGNPGESFNPVCFDYAYAAIFQIRQFSGVKVMVENIPNEISTIDRRVKVMVENIPNEISTIDRLQEFKAVSELFDIGICYDTGHGHLQGVTGDLDFVNATHIHDNHGERDEHLWPFDGKIDWPAFIEKLVLAKYTGTLIFEARGDNLQHGGNVRSRLRDLWDEAHYSIEEFRLKYKLPEVKNHEDD